jgi:hypothetical protein
VSLDGTPGTVRGCLYLRTIFVANFNYFDHTFRYVQDLFMRLIMQSGMWNFPWTNITFKSTKSLQYGEGFFVCEPVLRLVKEIL